MEVVALSHSITQTHSYAVVLGEVNGTRRLPIVIGGFEAQAIAVALENIEPTRPLTHDLMKNFMMAFDVELLEVVVSDLQEGIFYAKLVCFTEKHTIEIDSRTSDALALAVRFHCPIFVYENILENAGLEVSDSEKPKKKVKKQEEAAPVPTGNEDYKKMSLAELQHLLSKVVEQEDYIKAIAIRNEIESRNK